MIQRAVILAALLFFPTAAHATGPACCGGGGSSISANSCSVPGDFATGIATDGTLTCSTPSGGGNVSNTGTPANNQIAVWTDATTIEGDPKLTLSGSSLTLGDSAVDAGFTLATGLTGGTDPQIDFTNGQVDCANCRFTLTGGTKVIPDAGGGGVATRVPYWSDTDTLTDEAAFAYDSSTNTLTVTNVTGNASTASTASDLSNAGIDAVLPDIDGFGLSINTGTTPDELQLAPGEVTGPQVWGDGSGTMSWTFNTGITDPVIDFYNTGVVDVTGTLQMNTVPVVTTTGSQTLTNKTLTTPTIASFTNATHNHTNAAGGGTLTLAGSAFPNQGTTTTVLHGNAAGNPSWGQVSNSDLAGSISVSKTLLTDGAGILLSTDTLSTASTEANFLANAASVTCSSSPGKLIVDTTAETLAYCDGAVGSTQKWAALGNDSGESTAAANNSVALTTDTTGNYAAGDAEAGNATGLACTTCVDATDIATGAVTTGKILDATIAQVDIDDTQTLAGNPANGDSSVWFATTGLIWEGATSNSNEGLLVAADVGGDRTWTLPDASGTIAVSASTPLTLNATTGNLTIADAAADSSTKGAVTFPSTHFTCTSGTCSLLASPTFGAASGTSYTWTWDLSSGTDPSLIFSTGAVALGSSTGLYGSTSSSGDLNLFSTTHATKGQINLDDQVDLWPSVADLTTGNNNTAVRFNSSTFDISGNAVFSLLSAGSTTTMTGTLSGILFPYYLGLDFSPTTTVTGDSLSASYQYAVRMGGTSTTTAATHLPIAGGFLHNRTYTTSQVNGWVLGNAYALDDQPIFTQTSASGTQQMSGHYSLYHHPSFNSNGSNPSGFTVTNDFSILHGNVYTAAAGNTLTITARGGLKYDAYTTSGSGTVVVTDDTAVTCGALGVPGTQAACIKSAIQADAKRYFLKDTGGAQSSLAGKFTTYNNITTAGTGLPIITGESGVSATKTADFTALSYTPPATAGRYRVEQVITTTSGTNTGSFQCTVGYVDSQGTTHTADLMPMVNQTGLWATALPVVAGASKEWHCGPTYITINNSATAIVLKVDVTTGTVNYTVAASVEQLG